MEEKKEPSKKREYGTEEARWDGMPKKAKIPEGKRENKYFSWKAIPINILYKLQENDFKKLVREYSSLEAIAKALNMSKRILIKYAKIYAFSSSETYYDYFQRMKTWKYRKGINYTLDLRKKVQEIIDNKRVNTFPLGDLMYLLFRFEHKKECCELCGCGERRIHDGRKPLLLSFKNKKNIRNYDLKNLQILCYNCYFMTVGDVSYAFSFSRGRGAKVEHKQEIDAKSDIDWQFDYSVYSDKSEAIPEEQLIARKKILKKFDENL